MSKRKPAKPVVNVDLEATAELPVIDFAPASANAPESVAVTDIFPVPAIPVGTPELADSLREVEHQLSRELQRGRDMEMRLAAAVERQAALEAQLVEAGERQTALETQLTEARARQAALEAQMQLRLIAEQRTAAVRHSAADFAELRRRSERQLEALTCWQGFRAVSDALLTEAGARNAMLESQVARMGESLRALEGKRAPVASPGDGEKHALKSELATLKSEFGALQTVLASVRERQQQSEQQAEAETARARRLETEIQTSVALLGGPQKSPERPVRDDTGKHAVQKSPADAPLRVLVRLEGGSEVVYPIGRRTSIGRTPDNDIQIDVTNISRHHAVLLSGAEQCVVEDLNSTNGVLVNGQRVNRQVLRDGDALRIGKVEFRFQQRS